MSRLQLNERPKIVPDDFVEPPTDVIIGTGVLKTLPAESHKTKRASLKDS
jgi:hypothetical protein